VSQAPLRDAAGNRNRKFRIRGETGSNGRSRKPVVVFVHPYFKASRRPAARACPSATQERRPFEDHPATFPATGFGNTFEESGNRWCQPHEICARLTSASDFK